MEKIPLQSIAKKQFIDLSSELEKVLDEQSWTNGILTIFVPHTSAAITINENADPDVPRDILAHMERLIPEGTPFRHSEGNSDAHILASFFGSSVQVIIENGRMQVGTWQSVFFCEFDGPRKREIWIKFLSNSR